MKLVVKRTLTLLALFLVWGKLPISAQIEKFTIHEGQLILKTNPQMYILPEYNLALEAGIRDNLSLEGRFTWFKPVPGWIEGLGEPFNPSSWYPGWVTAHLMVRHCIPKAPILFFSYGMLFKTWKYKDHPVVGNDQEISEYTTCHLEDRRALVFGPKGREGRRLPMFDEYAVFEFYTGVSLKVRFEEGFRKQYDQCIFTPNNLGPFRETNVVPGVLMGFNLGIFLRY